ncbi:MAG TPA: tail fiber protein [Rhodothermales bacterium]|nr:tail fiber protein [Rhodothermales bacterium]
MPHPFRRPAPSALSRRRFLRRAGGALATGLLLPGLDWDAVYARASGFGIRPGALVDAAGNPVEGGARVGDFPYVAEICIFPFNFAPRGWAFCNGQLLPISSNTALFSLLGTFYGGDGQSTFALPDLQGSSPMGQGQGPGLSERFLGEMSGSETVTLLTSEMPVHTHSALNTGTGRRRLSPAADVRPSSVSEETAYGTSAVANSSTYAAPAGSSAAHNNMPPYLTLNFCIAMQGVFPPRG